MIEVVHKDKYIKWQSAARFCDVAMDVLSTEYTYTFIYLIAALSTYTTNYITIKFLSKQPIYDYPFTLTFKGAKRVIFLLLDRSLSNRSHLMVHCQASETRFQFKGNFRDTCRNDGCCSIRWLLVNY